MEPNPLVRKLSNVTHIDASDRQALRDLCAEVEEVPAKRDIISHGERPERVHLILEGWAARASLVRGGARQLTAFLIPGDFCDLHITILARMDHSITAMTPCKVGYIRGEWIDELVRDNSGLTRALWWSTLVDEAVLRQWVVNNGRRGAREALAHLLCELHLRMDMVGLVEDDSFALPLTQEELGDATGMTAIHTNRVLQELRSDGLIELSRRRLTIRKLEQLRTIAGFRADYLHAQTTPGPPERAVLHHPELQDSDAS